MTKGQFEKELKNLLCDVSQGERQKVLDYYRELFAEKSELGIPEDEIIAGFGRPETIAAEIMNGNPEMAGAGSAEGTDESVFDREVKKVKSRTKSILTNKTFLAVYFGACLVTIPLTIALGSVIFGFAVAGISIIFSFYVSGFACTLSGLLYAGFGIYTIATSNTNAGLAQTGVGFATIGVGVILFMLIWVMNYLRILLFVKSSNKKQAFEKANRRKKLRIASGIVCFCFILIGGCLFTAGFVRADLQLGALDTAQYAPVVLEIDAAPANVNLDVKTREIRFVETDENFRVESHDYFESKITISIDDNGSLLIKENYKFTLEEVFNIFKFANHEKQRIYIYLPKGTEINNAA